jgi:hypothetical protein
MFTPRRGRSAGRVPHGRSEIDRLLARINDRDERQAVTVHKHAEGLAVLQAPTLHLTRTGFPPARAPPSAVGLTRERAKPMAELVKGCRMGPPIQSVRSCPRRCRIDPDQRRARSTTRTRPVVQHLPMQASARLVLVNRCGQTPALDLGRRRLWCCWPTLGSNSYLFGVDGTRRPT